MDRGRVVRHRFCGGRQPLDSPALFGSLGVSLHPHWRLLHIWAAARTVNCCSDGWTGIGVAQVVFTVILFINRLIPCIFAKRYVESSWNKPFVSEKVAAQYHNMAQD